MKQRLLNWALKTVIRVVVPEDVIKTDKRGNLYLGDKIVDETELKTLQAEIKALENTRLWSILNETIKRSAFEKGWSTSTSMEHLNAAKTMYYVLDVQESIINNIKSRKVLAKN